MKTYIEVELDKYKSLLADLEADVKNREVHLEAQSDPEAQTLYREGLTNAKRRRDEMKALVEKQQTAVEAMLARATEAGKANLAKPAELAPAAETSAP